MAHFKPAPKSLNLGTSIADQIHTRLCIICQEDNKLPVTSEKTGRDRIKRAADIRDDIVSKRLKTLMGGG